MASFNRVLEVPYSPTQMFALVDRVEDYPDYLPWCAGVQVERLDNFEVLATLHLQRGALHHGFTTHNRHDPDALQINVQLAKGPLSFLRGQWRFMPLAGGGCRIEFEIDYEFPNRLLNTLLSPVFAAVYGRMIDAFVVRAAQVHGGQEDGSD